MSMISYPIHFGSQQDILKCLSKTRFVTIKDLDDRIKSVVSKFFENKVISNEDDLIFEVAKILQLTPPLLNIGVGTFMSLHIMVTETLQGCRINPNNLYFLNLQGQNSSII
jgi:hypothetical protein